VQKIKHGSESRESVKLKQTVVVYAVAVALAGVSGIAAASGFALIEQSASGSGNAYAGGAASAEDASTIFFNPAGMSRLSGKQLTVTGHVIKFKAEFEDGGSASPAASVGELSADAGGWAFLPAGHYVMEIGPQVHAGIGVFAPFGLKTEYPDGWAGRYQALKSSMETLNINPSISYKLSDGFSIGAGINYQTITAELTNAVFMGADGMSRMSGDDAAWGYNFGVLMDINASSRIGVSYRSSIDFKLKGNVHMTDSTGAPVATVPVSADFRTPDTFSVSYFTSLNERWDVMADLTRTGWGSFQELRIVDSAGTTQSLTTENWSNVWRAALGASYHYNTQWTARIGVAYDQTPVTDATRTARVPDEDRREIAVGGQYKADRHSTWDVSYAHLFVDNASVYMDLTADNAGLLSGGYSNSVDIFSFQYTHNF
jgi:long-chain fatty acid transport protein